MPDPEVTVSSPASPSSKPENGVVSKVLVVTDFSVEADAAIDRGVKLARLAGMQINLLHIVEVPTYQIHPEVVAASERVGTTFETLRQRALERLEAVRERIRQQGVNCTATARLGVPAEEILNEAEKTDPDLIVLGNKGTSGLTRFLLGSTAERVVRYAKCSVLVARIHL
jgi:nucleotide-binding universal stress UspA family protein